ncbi:hypothetical protein [uncultured Lamprocystis sp.]|jgi:hypothetical protein|uniref:hypothetical protein n=1 Tax=uncultured Lamprocystis sp. TaxID=543132 RepID=UPI0025CEBDFA|nr:hypothetical protein [uncultured Lamprocystis sp.]
MGRFNTEVFPIINRLTLPTLLCVFTASAWGQDATMEPNRPLDLTVPSGALTMPSGALTMPSSALTRTWGSPAGADAVRLPGLGEQPNRPNAVGGPGSVGHGGGHRSDLPYGTGYEARHGQAANGRGMGRGR